MSATLHLERDGRIATVRLDWPERHNVLGVEGWEALAGVFIALSAEDDVGCVVVRGTGGRAFSAGSDIGAFEASRDTPADVRRYSAAIAGALAAIRGCPHPVLALVEGLCVGGGLEIAAACDLRVCQESSRFGAPINRLGLTMAYEEHNPRVELLGPGPVMEVLLTGDLLDARRAREVGLVNRVFPDASAVEDGYAMAARVAGGAPLVNRWHKRFVRRLMDPSPVTGPERDEAYDAFRTADYREGRAAFVQKRPPRFTGE